MAEITDLDGLVAAVMPDVVTEVAGTTHELSTRALDEHATAPRIVWIPDGDVWGAPQKRTRGGGSTGRAIATVMAGVIVHVWGVDRAQTWTLVCAVVRSLRKRLGGADEVLRFGRGAWQSTQGAMTLGESYQLQVAVAIDVPALPDPPTTLRPTGARLDATASVPGDGNLDAGETGAGDP